MKHSIYVPGVVLKSANETLAVREGRFGLARTAKSQRRSVDLMLRSRLAPTCRLRLPVVVTITRHSPGELDAHDNLPHSGKHVCDAVAAYLGVDDRDPRLTWCFAQLKEARYGVTIVIEEVCGKTFRCDCCGATSTCRLEQDHEGRCRVS